MPNNLAALIVPDLVAPRPRADDFVSIALYGLASRNRPEEHAHLGGSEERRR